MNKKKATYLILTADDFGSSLFVNRAVEKAAGEGLLACASLMITGKESEDAVRIARRIPALQVGLHLALTEGVPASPKSTVSSLLEANGHFKRSPTRQGLSLQFKKGVERQVRIEVAAQFRAFSKTNLPFSHVDCHHHFHMHPRLFDIILENSAAYGLKTIRIAHEPWEISGPICPGRKVRNRFYRMVFSLLSSICKKKARLKGLLSSDGVFGLYQSGQITEEWVLKLIDRLADKPGVFELYTHPADLPNSFGGYELRALISPKVRKKLEEKGLNLIRYQDLESLF